MKESRLDTWQQFIEFEKKRATLKLSSRLEAMMDHCEYVLHVEFDKNTKVQQKHKKRKQELPDQYREAFRTLNRDEKLAYYMTFMKYITAYFDAKQEPPAVAKGMLSGEVFSRSYNLKMWKDKKMRLDREKHILYTERDNKIKTYMLENYLLRRSKNKDYKCFVLQAINDHPHQKSRTVHLGFKQQSKLNQWFKELTSVFNLILWNFVYAEMGTKNNRSATESEVMRNSDMLSEVRKTQNLYEDSGVLSKSLLMQEPPQSDRSNYQRAESPQFDKSPPGEQFCSGDSSQQERPQSNVLLPNRQTIIETIADLNIEQIKEIEQRQELKVITNQVKEDIFHRLMPGYDLKSLCNFVNYQSLFEEGQVKILGHLEQPNKLKMIISLSYEFSQKILLNLLTEPECMRKSNLEIEEIALKTMIKSQNSAMMYMKLKSYNKLYRPRDFIFLRHAFKAHENLYFIDKSIQNVSYPPFTTIVRGELCVLWGILKERAGVKIIADIKMKNQGYLNDSQNVNLTLKYLKAFSNIQKFALENKVKLQNIWLFQDNWNIVEEAETKKQTKGNNGISKQKSYSFNLVANQTTKNGVFKKKEVEPEKKQGKKQEPQPKVQETKPIVKQKIPEPPAAQQIKQQKLAKKYSHMQQQKGEINSMECIEQGKIKNKNMTVNGIKRQFDQAGCVIISNSFTRTKYVLSPLPKTQIKFQESIKGHPIWKGEWIHDDKVGAIIFVDQKKIQDQKGVLKFILSKIGKNLLSGKSVLNISLPVDIFSAESNLQRLLFSLTYAPTHLQPLVRQKSALQRIKKVVGFGISNSPLYLNMEKPFNPILGQTFQCWIDGCPAYAEQISHHPPIAALLYQGRGFRVTAQLQSKVQLHMNSGCGTNDGIFRIKFEDGMQVCYITPGGEVSGLAYGDRKFNMVGKAYFWIESENLFVEVVFNPTKKGFFSVGKQEQPIDYFEGQLCKVKPEFFEGFIKKRKTPIDKEITQKYGKFHGIWNKYVKYEEQTLLDIDKQFPAQLEYEANPLPSDANWREDIAYRRILEITRAQAEKQRLEVFQRKDRKLRQANPNYSHHKK